MPVILILFATLDLEKKNIPKDYIPKVKSVLAFQYLDLEKTDVLPYKSGWI